MAKRERKYDVAKFQTAFTNNKGGRKDERFWVLTKEDKAGTAVIRFLPNKNEDELPFKEQFKHSIFVNGKNFIDRCPTTIGKECPVCEWNKDLDDRDFILENGTYRKKTWICNIMVINDPKAPDNNGKVFLFEFGKQVHDILKETIQPDDGDEPMWYFDPDMGADFKIKVKNNGQFPTWVSSKFLNQTSIDGHLKKFDLTEDGIMDQLFDLDDVITNNSYKEFEELNIKFKGFLAKSDLIGDSGVKKVENEAVDVYSNKKKEVKNIINKKAEVIDDDDDDDEPTPPKSKNKDVVDKKINKVDKVKGYFKQFSDDDDD